MSKGIYLGLRFMAESKTANQWVHMDLKPQNMVINEDTGQTVIVDMGTVLGQGSLHPDLPTPRGCAPVLSFSQWAGRSKGGVLRRTLRCLVHP